MQTHPDIGLVIADLLQLAERTVYTKQIEWIIHVTATRDLFKVIYVKFYP